MQCHKLWAKIIKIVQHVQAAAKGFAGLVPAWAQQKICYSLLENLQEIFECETTLPGNAKVSIKISCFCFRRTG